MASIVGGGEPLGLSTKPSVGSYRLTSLLGLGAASVVHGAVDQRSGRRVALKVARSASDSESIHRECAFLRVVNVSRHPGIVRVFESGEMAGRAWYAMEELAGGSLEEVKRTLWATVREGDGCRAVAAGQLDRVLTLIRLLAEGIAHLHEAGLIHGDISPSNVLTRSNGEPVIADFGTAFNLGHEHALPFAKRAPAHDLASLGYCAPERLLGARWDSRADVYSLGCIAYELLTGRPVFRSDHPAGLYEQHVHAIPPAISTVVDGASAELDALLLSTLHKDPYRRIARASELATSLSVCQGITEAANRSTIRTTFEARLIGRDAVRTLALEALNAAGPRRVKCVLFSGEAGTGKSRILSQLRTDLESMGVVVRVAGPEVMATATRTGGVLTAFAPILREVATALQREEATQLAHADELRPLAAFDPSLAEVFGYASNPSRQADELARLAAFNALISALRVVSGGRRTAYLLDDLQLTDHLSVEFVKFYSSTAGAEVPVQLLVGLTEPMIDDEGAAHWGDGTRVFPLTAFSWHETALMCADVLAVDQVPEAFTRQVYASTKGNPFGITHLLTEATAAGVVEQRGATVRFAGLQAQGLPFVPRRLDQMRALSPYASQIAGAAAIIGRTFNVKQVEELIPRGTAHRGPSVREVFELLVSQAVVQRRNDADYGFTHELFRSTIEASLDEAEAAALHRRRALALQANRAVDENSGQIGLHWARGGQPRAALAHLRRAAQRVTRRFAVDDAVDLLECALEQSRKLELEDANRARTSRIGIDLMRLLARAGRHTEVVSLARALLDTQGTSLLGRARIRRLASLSSRIVGNYEQSHVYLTDGITELDRAPSSRVALRREWLELQIARSKLLYVLSRTDESRRLLRAVIPEATRVGTDAQRAEVYTAAANAIVLQRRYAFSKRALAFQRRAVALQRKRASADAALAMGLFEVAFMSLLGSAEHCAEARSVLDEATRLCARSGDAVLQARITTYGAIAARRTRDAHGCERLALRALEEATACGLRGYVGAAHGCLAWLALVADRRDEVLVQVGLARECWWQRRQSEEGRDSEYPFQWLAHLPLLAVEAAREDYVACHDVLAELLHPRQARLHASVDRVMSRAVRLATDAGVDCKAVSDCLRLASMHRYV